MKTKPITTTIPTTPASLRPPKAETFIGIDFHKRYSVYHVPDPEGRDLAKGRSAEPGDFAALVGRWKRPALMNCLRASGFVDWLCIIKTAHRDEAVPDFGASDVSLRFPPICSLLRGRKPCESHR